MLLAFIVWSSIALCIANPLHKYPYVFLLDVGNEELDKTNTEQLRITIPGGSLAMKYPALGEGDPISHVRVSGIDFGTDLKVNIVEGGPGYKHIVLMFMGNPGVTYDAVVTLQTHQTGAVDSATEMSLGTTNKYVNTENLIAKSYEVSDANEDDKDQDSINASKDMNQYSKKSKEVMQSTSTFYNFAKTEMPDNDEDKESANVSAEEQDVNDDDDDSADEEDDEDKFSKNGEQQLSNEDKSESSNQEDREVFVGDEDGNEENENVQTKLLKYSEQDHNQFSDTPRGEYYRYNDKADNKYDKYQDQQPRFGLGYRVYPQRFIYNRQYEVNSAYNKEGPVEFDQMYNDEEVHNDSGFKDGSNSIDSDYVVAEY